MPRTAAPGDFQVDVEGVGQFTFGRRTPRDVFRIRAEYMRLTDGHVDAEGNFADLPALAFATLKLLTVQAPDGFDLEFDPLVDDEWEAMVMRIWTELRAKELSFRPRTGESVEAAGA